VSKQELKKQNDLKKPKSKCTQESRRATHEYYYVSKWMKND
jgi:hypothetical protein